MKIDLGKYIKYLPMLAPIPEGYAVFLATEIMDWNPIIRGVAAVIVAGTGFWGVQVMNNMSEFNAGLRKKEQAEFNRLPTWKAIIILAVWFVGVILLTVFLDVYPVLQDWAPVGIVVIGFSAAFLFNLSNLYATSLEELTAYRQNSAKIKQEKDADRQSERKERKAHRQAIATKKQEIAARLQDGGVERKQKSGAKLSDAMLLLEWSIDPTLTPTEMAKKLVADGTVDKVSRQAIDGRLKSMIEKGLVMKTKDGRVLEVIFEDSQRSGGTS